MKQVSTREFERRRCKFHRLADKTQCTGWIVKLEGKNLIVRIDSTDEFKAGDTFLFEVFGNQVRAVFKGSLVRIAKCDTKGRPTELDPFNAKRASAPKTDGEFTNLVILLNTDMKFLPTKRAGRLLAANMSATIRSGRKRLRAVLIDYSSGGLALETSEPHEPGANLCVQIDTVIGGIKANGVVIYSEPIAGEKDRYRIGLEIKVQGRTDVVRWRILTTDDSSDFLAA